MARSSSGGPAASSPRAPSRSTSSSPDSSSIRQPRALVDDRTLEASSIVANRTMNRERQAVGVNSYERELHLDPIGFLEECLQKHGCAAWLDLCCGTGRALIAAARHLAPLAPSGQIRLDGIDLVSFFDPVPAGLDFLGLRTASLHEWAPTRRYDLVTCVHGMHYIGDKLALIGRAVAALESHGVFVANLDLHTILFDGSKPPDRRLLRSLRGTGLKVDPRQHLVSCTGPRSLAGGWRYLGADDHAGPNYTGQPGVASHYRWEA